MQKINVSVLVGSLRRQSASRKVAKAIVSLAPATLAFDFVELGELPLYNEDLEQDPPAAFTRFRSAIAASQAVLFVTPEYNRGVPGLLKNAVDVGSRPWGKSVWSGKPAGVVSTSYGMLGGMAANHQLRQAAIGVNLSTMPYPEAYISNAPTLFNEAGELTNASTKEFLTQFGAAFADWIALQLRLPPRA